MNTRRMWGALLMAAGIGMVACATFKTPTLTVQNVGKARVGLTGMTLNVEFGVRNPNQQAIRIDRIEYELAVNGHNLGRGFVPDPVSIGGFGSERVSSQFDVGFLQLPGAIKDIITGGRTRATVSGDFYLRKREGAAQDRVHFSSDADVDFRQP